MLNPRSTKTALQFQKQARRCHPPETLMQCRFMLAQEPAHHFSAQAITYSVLKTQVNIDVENALLMRIYSGDGQRKFTLSAYQL